MYPYDDEGKDKCEEYLVMIRDNQVGVYGVEKSTQASYLLDGGGRVAKVAKSYKVFGSYREANVYSDIAKKVFTQQCKEPYSKGHKLKKEGAKLMADGHRAIKEFDNTFMSTVDDFQEFFI